MRRALVLLAACGGARAAPDAACVTSISGVVYAPNGTLPLWNVAVYVPAHDPGPFTDGVTCGRCALAGDPRAAIATDEHGHFTLANAPAGDGIPLVITTGKWRRQITVPHVEVCRDTPLDPALTRLPRVRGEGDIPRIAISTGVGDALECLVRKLGISDLEITTDAQGGRVQLYSDRQAAGQGADRFAADFPGGRGFFGDSAALWTDASKLLGYDLVMLSCEGAQYPATKPQVAMDAIQTYANAGGRLYLSHWHDIWIEGATQRPSAGQIPKAWPSLATFDETQPALPDGSIDTVDPTTVDGAALAAWLPGPDVPLAAGTGRQTCTAVDPARVDTFVRHGGAPQMFQFTTPVDTAPDVRCGKVAFTDMHVSGDSTSTIPVPFPGGCATTELTPQEKVLAFMLFDLGSCLGDLL